MRPLSARLNLGTLILALALLSAIIALANTLLASYRVQRDQLVGKIQERYGYEKDQAEKEVSDWEHKNDYRW